MKKLHLIVLLFIAAIGYSQVSKNYKQLSNKDNANYYTIVADARAEFAAKDLTVLANYSSQNSNSIITHIIDNIQTSG